MPIFKKELQLSETTIMVGRGSYPLSAKNQHDSLVVYYEETNRDEQEALKFHYFMTGQDYRAPYLNVLDTVMLNDGNFVVHVFWESVDE